MCYREFEPIGRALIASLEPLLEAGKWAAAYDAANKLDLQGLVAKQRSRLRELGLHALLFGAHKVTGDVYTTHFATGRLPIPAGLDTILYQFEHALEHDAADLLRLIVANAIRAVQLADDDPEPVEKSEVLRHTERGISTKHLLDQQGQGRDKLARDWEMSPRPTHGRESFIDRHDPLGRGSIDRETISDRVDTGYAGIGGDLLRYMQLDTGRSHLLHWQTCSDPECCALDAAGGRFSCDPVPSAPIPRPSVSYVDPLLRLLPGQPDDVYHEPRFQLFVGDRNPDPVQSIARLRKGNYGKEFQTRLNDAVMNGGKQLIDIGATMTTSRLINFGFLAQAKVDSVERYKVSEVLDGKTCPVCRAMHGRIFAVDAQHDRTLDQLGAVDPATLRIIAPWPRQDRATVQDLEAASAQELQDRGLGAPPYHPNCRGVLELVDTVDQPVAATAAAPIEELIDNLAADVEEQRLGEADDTGERRRESDGSVDTSSIEDQALRSAIEQLGDDEQEDIVEAYEDGDLDKLKALLDAAGISYTAEMLPDTA